MNGESLCLASRLRRLIAYFIDGIIQGVTVGVVMYAILALLVSVQAFPQKTLMSILQDSEKIDSSTLFLLTLLAFAVWVFSFLLLNGYLLMQRGQTIGKLIMKIRIVDLDGRLPSPFKVIFLRSILLSLLTYIPVLGSMWFFLDTVFIFGGEKRCIHDRVAGTLVVDA